MARRRSVVGNLSIVRAFSFLGVAIANAISILDVSEVVIGGGVAKVGDTLFSQVRSILNDRLLPIVARNCIVRQTCVPAGQAGVWGAVAAVALSDIEQQSGCPTFANATS